MAETEIRRPRHAKALHVALRGFDVRGLGTLDRERVRIVRPGHDVEHQRVVGNSPGDRTVIRPVVEAPGQDGLRDDAGGRLQPDDPAERRRDTHRSRAVTALGEWPEPCSHSSRRTATGPARAVAELPRVVRRPVQVVVRATVVTTFGSIRLSQEQSAGATQPVHDDGISRRDVVGHRLHPERGRQPVDCRQIFDRERNAVQRAEFLARFLLP